MRHPIRAFLVAFLLLAPLVRAAETKPDTKPFQKEIEAFEAADKASPPPANAILFVGSSTFRLWKTMEKDLPGYTLINRGFGGSQFSDAINYVDRIVLPYKPRMIVVHEGGNDINAGKSPEQVLADCTTFVALIRKAMPDVPIVLSSIPPAPVRWSQADKIRRANKLLQDFATAGHNVQIIDCFNPFLDAEGKPREDLFIADRLHPNAEGYKLRATVTRPFLGKPDKAVPEN